jgi:hypothetical protein
MANNISKVYLLNVPLEDDMKNTLYFASSTAQHNYFNSNISKTYNNVSYQSETRTFRCPDQIDSVRQHNYIMWQNTAYSGKWFYAFIKKMTYVSDGFTDVEFEVDPLQTWMFDITIKPSFVEREHTNNDTPGNNTLEEPVALGPFVFNGNVVNFANTSFSNGYLAVGVSEVIDPFDKNNPLTNWLTVYGGIYSGLTYMFFDSFVSLQRVIDYYVYKGKTDALQTIFYVPNSFISASSPKSRTYTLRSETNTATVIWIEPSDSPILISQSIGRATSLDGYVPRNKKLLTHPYCYFNLTNNNGAEVDYSYEDFSGNPTFSVRISLCPSMAIKCTPTSYKNGNSDQTWSEGIMGAKTPQCSWTTDYYTNWLTQNAVNIPLQAVNTAVGVSAGLATGNYLGAGTNFLGAVSNVINENYKASLVPDQVHGNLNSGDISFSRDKLCFTLIPKSIKAQYARIIDDWFDMFGYKTNRVKVPNTAHRQNWWYTKTINANITGNVPNEEMNKIKEAYNNGLTFWRNPSNFLNYGVSNGIV